jgi:flagellar M-ring protein FliF
MLSDQTGTAGQLPGPGPAPNIPSAAAAAAQHREELEQMIDINQVEGRVKASSLKKIGEIIDKHPEETVSIIRTWMFQET